MTHSSIVEYALFDRDGRPIFARNTGSIVGIMMDVAGYLGDPVFWPLFPITVEALDRSDIFTTVTTITAEYAYDAEVLP